MFRNWRDIFLWQLSRETTQMNKPPKHYTKTGGHNINYRKKKWKHAQWVSACQQKGPSLTRDA